MTEERIALAVIAGDSAIEEGFENLISSVESKVHGIFVAFTGKDSEVLRQIEHVVGLLNSTVKTFPWESDFSVARNQSFDMVRESEEDFDWIFWLDCDDILPDGANLQTEIRYLRQKRAHGGFVNYNYSLNAETGVVFASHMKERLFRADVDWTWQYPIHECCSGPIATRMTEIDPEDFSINHIRGDATDKRSRNRAIVARWYREEPDSLRAKMFMAHEVYAEAELEQDAKRKIELLNAALKIYQDFIAYNEPDDDSYACNRQVADILMQLGRINDSVNIDLQGIKMQATWPASYVGIAETLLRAGDYEDSIEWADVTMRACAKPKTLHVFNNLDLTYRPLMIKAKALRKLGRPAEALKIYHDQAAPIINDDFLKNEIKAAIKEEDEIRGTTETDLRAIHSLNWGKQPEKSVAFFLTQHVEPWNPDTLKKNGLGGTETCVLRLAQELGSRGWRVAIYGEPGDWEGRTVGGVEWYSSSYFHPDQPFSAVVAVRFPPIFDANVNAKAKILWLHDVNMGDVRYQDGYDRFNEADVIVTPSPFHARHTVEVYGEFNSELHVILNGMDRDVFEYSDNDAKSRDPNHMVYASSPDRGLERLLDLWPDIREQMPNAWLEVFYGWDTIDGIIASGADHSQQLIAFKKRINDRIEFLGGKEGGIFWRGRVRQVTLAYALKKASVMPYPSSFEETFGLVFAQAMTAGCLPVVPNLGNMPDLIGDRYLIVDGAPDSENFGGRFVDALVLAAHDVGDIRAALAERTKQLTWDKTTDVWEDLLTRTIERDA